ITVEYSGDKVLTDAGNGSYYVQARESWYPDLNGFNERALYDLTYKIPKKYKLISVGTLDREWTEGDFSDSHWTTSQPVAIAGCNFGEYHKIEAPHPKTRHHIYQYHHPELPTRRHEYRDSALQGISPRAMTE